MDKIESSTTFLRNLPGIDTLLQTKTSERLVAEAGPQYLAGLARRVTDNMRDELRQAFESGGEFDKDAITRETLLTEAESRLEDAWRSEQKTGLQRVINASGVIIHTNLGRAPLSDEARKAAVDNASRYCNLEYDIETGKRGKRGARAEKLLTGITGAESALIVNNCAAACVLVLTALAKGGETIISRGELVEIGGDFRVPDVMEESGAKLVEVGTTNKTKASDYERAITENTKMITRVHPSNYRIVGFTAKPTVAELAEIAHRHGVLLYEDAGSGALEDMTRYGLSDEPRIAESISAGADVVTFSGDKLIGGIQSGLIVGKREVIEQIRRNPLYRAMRASKMVYAILESTFDSFRRGDAFERIPVLRMLAASKSDIRQRTLEFVHALTEKLGEDSAVSFEVGEGRSVVGGGSAPAVQPQTTLLAVKHKDLSASEVEKRLRNSNPAVICRLVEDRAVLDLRTVQPDEEDELLAAVASLNLKKMDNG